MVERMTEVVDGLMEQWGASVVEAEDRGQGVTVWWKKTLGKERCAHYHKLTKTGRPGRERRERGLLHGTVVAIQSFTFPRARE